MDMYDIEKETDKALNYGINFDVVKKKIILKGDVRGVYYYINAFGNGELTEKIMSFLLKSETAVTSLGKGGEEFAEKEIPVAECSFEHSVSKAVYYILSGTAALIIEGLDGVIVIDTRHYPARGVSEPANDRVLRGSRDGFVESLNQNVGLIRRRIRNEKLIVEKHIVGKSSACDLAVCYMSDKANKKLLDTLRNRLGSIELNSVSMGLESIAESIGKKSKYNPFPRIRYTERPDTAAAMINEGSIIILCDNYPSAMIFPTYFFSFAQDTNDFYFPPVIGKYLKFVRLLIYGISLFLTPVWYLIIREGYALPERLSFIIPEETGNIPVILQLIAVELSIDGLKLASLNTPDSMSNSLGIIGGLLLGDFAVKSGWLSPEVIFYMSFIAIANFTQPNFEMGYAFKFMRIITLILISIFGIYGFIAGIVFTVITVALNPSPDGAEGYLYPLIPFNARALYRLLFRATIGKKEKE